MSYTSDAALDFWYEYDQAFLFAASPEVGALYEDIYGQNFAIDALVDSVRDNLNSLPTLVQGREASFRRLAAIQLDIIDRRFPDSADLQRAFEDFGQGILFDQKVIPTSGKLRRPPGRLIHMMDGTPDDCVGYHRWHAFIRAAVAAGADSSRWLQVNQLVALAWAIYSELDPHEDAPTNPPLSPTRLASLRRGWLAADEATLNEAFLHYVGKFPDDYVNRRAKSIDEIRYWRVQNVFVESAKGSNPQHSGARKVWELPMASFIRASIYGNNLIAPKGPGRGAASALTMVLRGTLSGFPRMPLHRPPLDPADIAYIERWIDDLEAA